MDTTMYLSRFLIPRQAALKRRLFSEYELHRALWTCFPGIPAGTVRPFLFRTTELAGGTRILMLSKDRPIPLDFAEWDGTKSFRAEFAPGSLFLFRLRANPVKRVTADNRLRAITDRHAPDSGGPSPLRVWLEGKARLHGNHVVDVHHAVYVVQLLPLAYAAVQGLGRHAQPAGVLAERLVCLAGLREI